MKKVTSYILAVIMAVSIVACGGQTDSPGSSADPTPQPAPKVLSDTLTISKYDETSAVITNEYTGLEFTPTDQWEIIDRDTLCRTYMKNITGQQLEAMNADELNRHTVIPDWAVRNNNGNVVLSTVINYEKDGMTFDEYLPQFKETNTRGSFFVSDVKTVILSGVEYQNITAFYENNTIDICYKDRGDGHMAVVMSNLGQYCTPQYVHAFFNGGPDAETDIENVPELFEFDNEKGRIINTDTGIEIDIPYGWGYSDRQSIAETYYSVTEDQLNSMTAKDFAGLSQIEDIYLLKDDRSISVSISYINRNHATGYGLSAEDMQLFYKNQTNLSAAHALTYDNVSFAGQSYYATKKYYYNADTTYLYLFREINEDYMAKVMIAADGDCSSNELRKIFDVDNDTDMLIKRSEYVEGKYQYYNQYSNVGINVLKGWERNDQLLFNVLNDKNLSEDRMAEWTDEDYMNSLYIPDFAVSSEDQTIILMAYYINLNKYSDGKPDIDKLYNSYMADFENSGNITVESNTVYTRGGHDYLVYQSTTEDGKIRMQFATAAISDDYAIMLLYITPIDGAVPNVTGVIHDPA